MTGGAFAFRPLAAADIALMHRWLAEPHVARWWGDPDEEARLMHVILSEADTDAFVASLDGEPVGYAQAWQIEPVGAYPDQPAGTRAVDVFIGPRHKLGKGHGVRMIEAFSARLLAAGAARVITDPARDNHIAQRAYARAGFVPLGQRNTPDGPVALMARDPGLQEDLRQ